MDFTPYIIIVVAAIAYGMKDLISAGTKKL